MDMLCCVKPSNKFQKADIPSKKKKKSQKLISIKKKKKK